MAITLRQSPGPEPARSIRQLIELLLAATGPPSRFSLFINFSPTYTVSVLQERYSFNERLRYAEIYSLYIIQISDGQPCNVRTFL